MIQEQRDALGRLIANTALYYGKQITRDVISMMVDDLADLDFEEVTKGYLSYRRDPKNRAMPLPAQIREIAAPRISAESEAREAVERIREAIVKFGYPQGASACAFIGEVGWKVVQGMGGWTKVCESDFIHNGALIAQARSRAQDLLTHAQLASGNHLPSLPTKDREQGLKLIVSNTSLLPKGIS